MRRYLEAQASCHLWLNKNYLANHPLGLENLGGDYIFFADTASSVTVAMLGETDLVVFAIFSSYTMNHRL